MKTKPVPTSPKVRKNDDAVKEIYKDDVKKSFDQPTVRSRGGVLLLVLATLSGFLAGVLGETIINALAVSYPNLPVISALYVEDYSDNNTSIIIEKNGKTIEAQEFEVLESLGKVQPTIAMVFEKNDSEVEDILKNNYQSGNSLGSALILTDDGLLVTTDQVISDIENEFVVVTSDKKIYSVEEIVEDTATNLIFVRIIASNLSVAEFVDPVELRLGQKLVTLINKTNGNNEIKFSTIADLNYYNDSEISDLVYSTETLSDLILVNNSISNRYLGAPFVTTSGKVVGVAYKKNVENIDSIIPGEYIQKMIIDILDDDAVTRTYFGVTYIDLSRAVKIESDVVEENSIGALIYGGDDDNRFNSPTITEKSPAASSDLESGDIIISFDGKMVSSTVSLSELVQDALPGNTVDIEYLREDNKFTTEVLLTDIK
jgi:S1-C subfamily serine protease